MYRDGQRVYEGRVLATGEMNYHDDSDFYAVVLEDDGTIKRVSDGTTRFAAPPTAHVDATPETIAAAEAALANYIFEDLKREAAWDAEKITVGKRVRATKGRKVAVGTEATCIWLGWNEFRPRYANSYSRKQPGVNEDRIGIKLDDGSTVFADKYNFEVADPGDNMPSFAQLRTEAERQAKYHNWRYVGSAHGLAFV